MLCTLEGGSYNWSCLPGQGRDEVGGLRGGPVIQVQLPLPPVPHGKQVSTARLYVRSHHHSADRLRTELRSQCRALVRNRRRHIFYQSQTKFGNHLKLQRCYKIKIFYRIKFSGRLFKKEIGQKKFMNHLKLF